MLFCCWRLLFCCLLLILGFFIFSPVTLQLTRQEHQHHHHHQASSPFFLSFFATANFHSVLLSSDLFTNNHFPTTPFFSKMTMENTRVVGSADHFPVGLRVLAVDDDRACLKLLEALLRRCQYHVTVTNQAIDALKLLRDNKNKFDLVISDVHMPDMDGFKLLELVGLEMDLPVIMLSGNSDPKAVMKGITHGACDYLLKPVRLEELKNIWQHVVRRKRFDSRDVNSYDHVDEDTDADGSKLPISHHAHAPGPTASSELNTERSSRKRKDQDEGEDDDFDDNDDSSMQKKPRVVWSIELHRKFVAAVNQLGIDKAMPKRILDLMNDEKLTRENVASHLQKYRLYLKRISSVTSHQANMVAALGGKDSPYLQIGSSLENARNNYHSFTTSGNLSTLASFQQGQGQGCGGSGGMFGILNCPTGPSASGLYNLASSGMIQLGYGRSNNNPPTIHDLGRLQQSISFSGGGTQAQAPKMSCSSDVGALSPVANSFLDTLKQPSQPKQHSGLFNNQPILASASTSTPTSRIAATLSGDPFEMKTGSSSIQTDEFCTGSRNAPAWSGIINDTWYENLASSSKLGEIVGRNNPNMKANTCSDDMLASLPLSTTDDRLGLSVSDMIAAGGSGSKPSSWFEGTAQMTNFNYNSPANSTLVGTCNREDFIINGVTTNDDNMANGSFNLAPVYTTQNSELDQVVGGTKMQGGGGGGGGFDGLISAIVKRERDEVLMEGDIGCDIYSLETCM